MNIIFAILFSYTLTCQLHASYLDRYPDSCLIHALKNNILQDVLMLLQSGIPLNCADNEHNTPLMYATLTGNDKLVRLMLQYGARINYAPHKNHTALHDIVYVHTIYDHPIVSFNNYQGDYVTIIMTLILYGADFSQFTHCIRIALEDSLPALHMAVLMQQEKKLQKLLIPQTSWITKFARKFLPYRYTRIHTLAVSSHTALVNPEIARLVNQPALNTITPLHIAAARGSCTLVHQLIAAGAELNLRDNYGNTPLHYAAINGHTAAIELLLTAGADSTSSNNDGLTPLQFAHSMLQKQDVERNTQVIRTIDTLSKTLRSRTL